MIIDRYTKAVLTLIAISLFMIALNPWIAPTKAYGDAFDELQQSRLQSDYLKYIFGHTGELSVGMDKLLSGRCGNAKICE